MHFTYEVKQTTHLEMSIDIDENLYTKQVASFSKGGGVDLTRKKRPFRQSSKPLYPCGGGGLA